MKLRIPLLAGLVLLLACCGSPTGSGGSGGSGGSAGSAGSRDPGITGKVTGPDRPVVTGRSFVSTRVTVDGAAHALVTDSRITISFTADQISLNAGCNTLGGPIRTEGSRITLRGDLASTAMGCPSAFDGQDKWLTALVTAGLEVGWQGDLLTLTSGRTVITLQDQHTASADAALLATRWTLSSIVEGDVARTVPAGLTATLVFDAGSPVVLIDSGCNTGSAQVVIRPDRITFASSSLTARGCPPEASWLESTISGVLQGEVAYHLDGKLLTLTNGMHSLVYRAG